MSKKLTNYLGWAILAPVLAIGTSYLVTSRTKASPRPMQSSATAGTTKPLKPLTYFFTLEESLYNLDGSKITYEGREAAWEIVHGQRADGAHVNMMWNKSDSRHAIRHVDFPNKGITIDVNAANGNKTTWGTGVPEDATFRMKHTDYITCGTGNLPGKDTIQGFKFVHTVRKSDQEVRESWLAPAFDCREIRTVLTTTASRTIFEPLFPSDKPPDDSYFVIKDGLKEMDPIAFRQSLSDTPVQFPASWAENLMQSYESDKSERIKRQ